MEKDIKNISPVTHQLKPTLTKITNHKLEFARKEEQKREEIIEKQKTEAISIKYQRAKEEISLFKQKRGIMKVILRIKQI